MELPITALRRHLVALGAAGSGKTVLCKVVMEEAVRNEIPVLIVDPQGDIASLALPENADEIADRGTSLTLQREYLDRARVAIFTPGSNKGIRLSMNPLKFPSPETPRDQAEEAIDMMGTSLTSHLGYKLTSDRGRGARAYLVGLLVHLWHEGRSIQDLNKLADVVEAPPPEAKDWLGKLVEKERPEEISRKLRHLTVGARGRLFRGGVPIDMEMFLDRSDGKVPVNVIYLNTLAAEADKQFFLATLLREFYLWMLRNPSDGVQVLLYVDEIAPYIPAYPYNPPTKRAYRFLFKQARKYGVGLVAATQNVTDIDYKALAQVSTWCLGRMMMRQDIDRVDQVIRAIDPERSREVLGRLPGLKAGEFLILSPDVYEGVVRFRVRWLATRHSTMDEAEIRDALDQKAIDFFKKYQVRGAGPGPEPRQEPAEPSPQLEPLEDRIRVYLNATREAVSAKFIARGLKVPTSEVEEKLSKLRKQGVVDRGRTKGGEDNLYWLSKFGFNPSSGIVAEVLSIPRKITQVEALRKSKRHLEGGFFNREEVLSARVSFLPIWRIRASRAERRVLFLETWESDIYYVSGKTGAIVSLGPRHIEFRKLMETSAKRLKDLDEEEEFVFVPKAPSELGKLPRIKVSLEDAYDTLRRTLGVRPLSGKLAMLPVWTLTVGREGQKRRRKIVMDATTGRTLKGHF